MMYNLNPTQIVKWVNDFRVVGPDALRSRKKGGNCCSKANISKYVKKR